MKKRLEQAFLETSILLGWCDSQIAHGEGSIPDDLITQSLNAHKKLERIAKRLGYKSNETLGEDTESNIVVKFPLATKS